MVGLLVAVGYLLLWRAVMPVSAEEETELIIKAGEAFISEYETLCGKLKLLLKT